MVGDGHTARRVGRPPLARAQRDGEARALPQRRALAPCCCRRNGTAADCRSRRQRSRGRAAREAPHGPQCEAPPSADGGGQLVLPPHRRRSTRAARWASRATARTIATSLQNRRGPRATRPRRNAHGDAPSAPSACRPARATGLVHARQRSRRLAAAANACGCCSRRRRQNSLT